MEPKKMTDEEIESLLGGNYAEIYAHIAASEAERKCEGCGVTVSARPHCITCWEEMKAERDDFAEQSQRHHAHNVSLVSERNAAWKETDALRKQIISLTSERGTLERERNTYKEEASAYEARWNALRERVQALEAHVEKLKLDISGHVGVIGQKHDHVTRLQDHLAAIRQRAGNTDALAKAAETCAIMGSTASVWDGAVHADVVARGDEKMLRDVARGVADYVVGEDATGAVGCVNQHPRSPESVRHLEQIARSAAHHVRSLSEEAPASPEPVDGEWEGPAHPSPERDPSDTPEPSTAECPLIPRCDSETPGVFECRAGCACRTCHPREPSTAELVATVRSLSQEHVDDDEARCLIQGNLSLLERRMVALEGLKAVHMSGGDVSVVWPLWRAVDEALTDAPRVFTEAEVEKACRAPTWTDDFSTERGAGFREGFEKALASVLQSLAALRKG